MKKIINLIIILLLMFSLFGCKKEETELKDSEPGNVLTGSWEINYEHDEFSYENNELIEFLSNKDLNGYDNYNVLALLGSQVVAGRNYMFLCQSDYYEVVVVYLDLSGNMTITNTNRFEFTDYLENHENINNELLMGGWTVNEEQMGIKDALPLEKALVGFTGANYLPLVLLGTQIVSGTNYCYLTYETLILPTKIDCISVVVVYEDLAGEATISSVYNLDLKDFNK